MIQKGFFVKAIPTSIASYIKQAVLNPSYPQVLIVLSLFWVALANQSFFSSLLNNYPLVPAQFGFIVAVFFLLFGSTLLVLSLLVFHRIQKLMLIVLLMSTAASAYFMDSYHSVIDESMLINIMKTDHAEAMDLFSFKLLGYLLLLGLLPSIWVYRAQIEKVVWKKAIVQRVLLN
jgi:lipid A ethanolaminephosphotransferase